MSKEESNQDTFYDSRGAYEQFLDEVIGTEVVWGLSDGENWAICDSEDFDEREVIPFWSNEKHAARLCVGEWSVYKPTAIRFDDFVDAWLHGMNEDQVLAGVNWDEDLNGAEIEPILLIDDLLEGE
ncbi:MAG: DUF2750 domain-containing protein [Kangiellaceae bacterium]|nr:DUF2750 domain-containing protein [Kangiellaceae bacterium]MCW9000272.1 DUF2750 domain-containing protein [Kangiellaceae bacterium]MCW9016947.1 DUF2750 domain-containing protein [Kangiellaceae bacterium]